MKGEAPYAQASSPWGYLLVSILSMAVHAVRNFIAQAVCGFSPVNPHTSAPPKPHAEGSFATPS